MIDNRENYLVNKPIKKEVKLSNKHVHIHNEESSPYVLLLTNNTGKTGAMLILKYQIFLFISYE